jgi:NAD(P)-dependent dehydrogenase (short-subunit alcohol dehydrogenase family)
MSVYPLRVDGKTIVVTGGYGYLGKAIVESLAFHGANVIVAARKEKNVSNLSDSGFQINFVEMDVSDSATIANAFSKIFNQWSKIDVIINNAFYLKGQSPEAMTDEEWNYGIDGTLNSVFRCIREIIPYFKKQGYGKIINVSSMYGVVAPDFTIYDDSPAFLNPAHYGAAKAGVLQLTRYYASYLGPWNIQVNAVTPGPYPAEQVQKDEHFIKQLSEKTCLGRIGQPNDVAGAFVFLASDAANYVTGQNIIVDGGWTVK